MLTKHTYMMVLASTMLAFTATTSVASTFDELEPPQVDDGRSVDITVLTTQFKNSVFLVGAAYELIDKDGRTLIRHEPTVPVPYVFKDMVIRDYKLCVEWPDGPQPRDQREPRSMSRVCGWAPIVETFEGSLAEGAYKTVVSIPLPE